MNILVVYSHPNMESFNHAILETLVAALKDDSHEVRVRDLYDLKFDPVLKGRELAGFKNGIVPDDVKIEQEHIVWADIIFFICPIWWGGMTAQLRGYFDRVFSLNFAYAEIETGIKGLLSDKKAIFINTIGAPEHVYSDSGMFKSMTQTIDEVIGSFCGMTMLEHKYFSSVGTCSDDDRKAMLVEVEQLAKRLV